ncbi:MAG: undecaprenyl-diphosphatase UppP [bacterium]|nr:undecaprenyl-diphosphatase UppP [bacterium]MDZ4247945.1 undecaprenyl-diphosphatase UppP [Patescibacteria group bacterium]
MDYLYATILGIIQGLTEFLPISSTGHLALTQEYLRLDQAVFGLQFDAAIQLGTTVAVIWFFRNDFWNLFRHWRRPAEKRLLLSLGVATLPALVIGAGLERQIEGPFRDPAVIATALVIGAFVFFAVERVAKQRRGVEKATWKDALAIGFAQALALVPGVSRSGATISAGMLLGLKREAAARFAFLLSVPIIAAAGGKKLVEIVREPGQADRLDITLVGLVVSGIVGYATIKYLLKFLAHHRLDVFAWYRLVLAGVIVLTLL